jgi:polyisoprenoid-binding protein YceI
VVTDGGQPGDLGRGLDDPPVGIRPVRGVHVKWLVVVAGAIALIVLGGPWFLFHVIESPAPSPLRLPPAAGVGSGPPSPGPVSGTWQVAAGSEAGYRVSEVLLGQHHTAVGRTSKISGGIVISGTTVTAADFTVNLGSVKSDQTSRDAQFDGFIMETYEHPDARFHLTAPIRLAGIPSAGVTVSEPATGDLTMRGVRRSVTFVVKAERLSGAIDVYVEIPVTFSEWHIPNPSFAVAQVSNGGTIEVLLHLVPLPALPS